MRTGVSHGRIGGWDQVAKQREATGGAEAVPVGKAEDSVAD